MSWCFDQILDAQKKCVALRKQRFPICLIHNLLHMITIRWIEIRYFCLQNGSLGEEAGGRIAQRLISNSPVQRLGINFPGSINLVLWCYGPTNTYECLQMENQWRVLATATSCFLLLLFVFSLITTIFATFTLFTLRMALFMVHPRCTEDRLWSDWLNLFPRWSGTHCKNMWL